MAALALGWWVSLAMDAAQGRASWMAVTVAACGVLGWAVFMLRWAGALRPQGARLVSWHPLAMRRADRLADRSGKGEAPARWTDEQGAPLELRVRMDFGAGVLLQLCSQQGAGGWRARSARSEWRWVGADALAGPWRWRLISAASHGLARNDEEAERSKMASWTLSAPQKALLPKSARRSA